MIVLRRPGALACAVLLAVLTLLYLGSRPSSTAYLPTFRFPSSPQTHHIPSPGQTAASPPSYSTLFGPAYHGASNPRDINRVTNSTLGFSKIFVIGLPERSDKRDALTLAAALTGLDLDWIPAVRGESVPDKAVPLGADRARLMETNLGSWRSHIDAVRRVVEDGLDSALIMEDDMDWDVRVKPLLEVVASGVRTVAAGLPDALFPAGKSDGRATPRSPYGDDWDLLWLGHCGEPFPEELDGNKALGEGDAARRAMSRRFTVLNDATVPPLAHITGLVNFTAYPEHTRWVHVTAAPICTFAYALSQKGARKVLFDLSVDRLNGPFDNALAHLCRRAVRSWGQILRGEKEGEVKTDRDRGLDAKCFSVTPPVFFHHKARGPVARDSDIQVVDEDEKLKESWEGKMKDGRLREKGTTENIVWSARLNLRNMLMGEEMESQW